MEKNKIINILFFHHSADLYGSDKVLLSLVTCLEHTRFNSIVLLPNEGPLCQALRKSHIKYYIIPMIRVSRATFTFKGIFKLLKSARHSMGYINKHVIPENIDIVHSNTLAVISGAIWSKIHRKPHVWHVHEMIEKPKMVNRLYRYMLQMLSTYVVFNSYAAKDLFVRNQDALEHKSCVVWNGMTREEEVNSINAKAFRQKVNSSDTDILIVMLGRINRWKGQNLLVDAAEILHYEGVTGVSYAIVGSVANGQEHYLNNLNSHIAKSSVRLNIHLLPFQSNVWCIWDACDIAVVPSIEPEPFGMVALEAMLARKPVIVANHGGLPEIVMHNQTGLVFEPGNAQALAGAIRSLLYDKHQRDAFGEAGYTRAKHTFSLEKYVNGLRDIYTEHHV